MQIGKNAKYRNRLRNSKRKKEAEEKRNVINGMFKCKPLYCRIPPNHSDRIVDLEVSRGRKVSSSLIPPFRLFRLLDDYFGREEKRLCVCERARSAIRNMSASDVGVNYTPYRYEARLNCIVRRPFYPGATIIAIDGQAYP